MSDSSDAPMCDFEEIMKMLQHIIRFLIDEIQEATQCIINNVDLVVIHLTKLKKAIEGTKTDTQSIRNMTIEELREPTGLQNYTCTRR